jgi:hypothetical protein
VYIRGQFVIRHCHLFLYRDYPYKRERGRCNDRRPSSKPGRLKAVELALHRGDVDDKLRLRRRLRREHQRLGPGVQGVRPAQKMRVGPCTPVGIQLERARAGPTSGSTRRLSHLPL